MNIFISYSTTDIEYAKLVQYALRILGFEAFLAANSLATGRSLREIHDHLANSSCAVLLWSEAASKSQWVQQEVGAIVSRRLPTIPVHLTKGLAMPPNLGDLKYLEAYEKDTASVLAIQARILVGWHRWIAAQQAEQQAFEAERLRKQSEFVKGLLAVGGVIAAGVILGGAGKQ